MTTTQTVISQDELTGAEWDERIRLYDEWRFSVQRLTALDHYYDAWWKKKLLGPGPEDRKAFLRGFADGLSGTPAPANLRGRRERRIYTIGRDAAQAI